MRAVYIAREALCPGFPAEDTQAIVDLMTADLEAQGYEVEVGDLVRSQDYGATQDDVDDYTRAWEKACASL